jgi:hypothetical protein
MMKKKIIELHDKYQKLIDELTLKMNSAKLHPTEIYSLHIQKAIFEEFIEDLNKLYNEH